MASDKVKTSSARLVTVPGYHIHPQYDMIHTRHIIAERRSKKPGFTLSLAPMVDMFSILVIYLIMNFSTEGDAFFVSKDIVIPKSGHSTPLKSLPLLSVVKGKVMFDAEKLPGQESYTTEELNDEKVPLLRANLRRLKKMGEQIGGSQALRDQVNIQADVNTPMDDIKKVMRVLVDEGWTGTNFVVEPQKESQ